jgi:pyruvate kinase
MRRTKIVCTLGPAVDGEAMLRELMVRGMNVARFNFSHGTHEEHRTRADLLKKVRVDVGLPMPLLLDTKGPEIRTGNFIGGSVDLVEGSEYTIVHDDVAGDATRCSITYKELPQDVVPGSRILIADGLVELDVVGVKGLDVVCRVKNGGTIGDHKGVNLPDIETRLPSLTEKDIDDIRFGVENGFDFIAASFVRKAADVLEIRRILDRLGAPDISIIAKIENREGLHNFDEILKVADGIMVARGDLGVEIPIERIPVAQKAMIEKCYRYGKPVITATQMLDSMIRNPRPTRAEVSDVANAVIDGTSALMLSGETAAGKYPLESLSMMVSITDQAEASIDYWKRFKELDYEIQPSVTNAISHATCTTAMDLKAGAIVTVTHSGRTARMISRFRPSCPIIATTVFPRPYRQLSLSWGVLPFLVEMVDTTEKMFDLALAKAQESGLVGIGDTVVITGGSPVGMSGTTNILKVANVGSVLVMGRSAGSGSATGEVCVVGRDGTGSETFHEGCVLVAQDTSNAMMPYLRKAAALVVESTDPACHAATVGLALEIPVVVGAENATHILKTGTVVVVDADRGSVGKA